MNLAGCSRVSPSRWTTLTPEAEASNKTSTKWAGRRFTSSMYKMPRLADARRPGKKTGFPPFFRVAEKSMDPKTRSSVAPMGRSTKGVEISVVSLSSLQSLSVDDSRLYGSNAPDSELHSTLMGGRSFPRPRAAVPRCEWNGGNNRSWWEWSNCGNCDVLQRKATKFSIRPSAKSVVVGNRDVTGLTYVYCVYHLEIETRCCYYSLAKLFQH